MYKQDLKIPKIRVAVLIGTNGETKRGIERKLSVKLDITKEGYVLIEGEDSLNTYLAKKIIKAISRGFSPNAALQLVRENYDFELFELRDFARSKNDILRLKGRIIGERGKSRKKIEGMTGCYVCIFGKTVGVIGPVDKIDLARRAISRLLIGARHSRVFQLIEDEKKK